MILRVVCIETDTGAAANVGGPVKVARKTFDVPCTPELAAYLRHEEGRFVGRWIEGVEVRSDYQCAAAIAGVAGADIESDLLSLPEMPDDMADAFESMKLAIMRNKMDGWREISAGEAQRAMNLLQQLIAIEMFDRKD